MHRRARIRALFALPALLAAGLVMAACSSSPSPARTSTTTSQPVTTSSVGTPTTATTTTLPAFPASGALQLGSPIATPLTSLQVVATEGPDGAVFVAAQAPVSPSPSVIYAVDGNGPAVVAEHFPSGIAALAADADNLYVATYATVTAFSRTSGNQSGQWSLPTVSTANSSDADLVSMTAAANRVFVTITQGNAVTVYQINPTSTLAPGVAAKGLSAAVGSDGTIYSEALNHTLTSLSVAGVSKQGPALADAPNSEGGGVQFVSEVAGGAVWVSEPAGQGEDTGWTTYDTTTLQQVASFGGNLSQMVVDTTGGALIVSSPDSLDPCSTGTAAWCLARVSRAGVQSGAVPSDTTLKLVGPDPVLIATLPGATQVQLWRIS